MSTQEMFGEVKEKTPTALAVEKFLSLEKDWNFGDFD